MALFLSGVVASLSLLGAQSLIFSHGLRTAVQDSPLLLLTTLATLLGFKLLKVPSRAISRESLLNSALLFGLLVGCASLVKSLFGLIPLLFCGGYALVTKVGREASRERWPYLLVAVAASFALPTVYFVSLCSTTEVGCYTSLSYEVLERFSRSYHVDSSPWLYLHELFLTSNFFPPGVTIFSLLGSVYLIGCKRSSPLDFLLLWVGLWLVGISFVPSRLPHYLYPALIPLALLIGHWCAYLYQSSCDCLESQQKRTQRVGQVTLALLCVSLLLILRFDIATISRLIDLKEEQVLDITLRDVRRSLKSDDGASLISLRSPELDLIEHPYLGFLGERTQTVRSTQELRAAVSTGDPNFVLSSIRRAGSVMQSTPWSSYTIVPPELHRPDPLLLVAYGSDLLLSERTQNIELSEETLLYGWDRIPIGSESAIISVGQAASILVDGDEVSEQLSPDLILRMGIVHPSFLNELEVEVLFNSFLIEKIEFQRPGYRVYPMNVPPGIWRSGGNTLTLRIQSDDTLASDQKVLLLDYGRVHFAH